MTSLSSVKTIKLFLQLLPLPPMFYHFPNSNTATVTMFEYLSKEQVKFFSSNNSLKISFTLHTKSLVFIPLPIVKKLSFKEVKSQFGIRIEHIFAFKLLPVVLLYKISFMSVLLCNAILNQIEPGSCPRPKCEQISKSVASTINGSHVTNMDGYALTHILLDLMYLAFFYLKHTPFVPFHIQSILLISLLLLQPLLLKFIGILIPAHSRMKC